MCFDGPWNIRVDIIFQSKSSKYLWIGEHAVWIFFHGFQTIKSIHFTHQHGNIHPIRSGLSPESYSGGLQHKRTCHHNKCLRSLELDPFSPCRPPLCCPPPGSLAGLTSELWDRGILSLDKQLPLIRAAGTSRNGRLAESRGCSGAKNKSQESETPQNRITIPGRLGLASATLYYSSGKPYPNRNYTLGADTRWWRLVGGHEARERKDLNTRLLFWIGLS